MPALGRTAGGSVRTDQSRTCTAVFSSPTAVGSLVVVVAAATMLDDDILYGPSGFTVAAARTEDNLTVAIWYRAACPALSSVSVAANTRDPIQVRAMEYTGMAQTAVLDRVSIFGDNDENDGYTNPNPFSGLTALTTQGDEVIVGVLANRYPSAGQSGFGGGLALLSNTTTPSDEDYRRSQLTVHQAISTQPAQWQLTGRLGTGRDWVCAVLTFKGGTTGPARMTSLAPGPMFKVGGSGSLTVFGPLKATENLVPAFSVGGSGRIGPFAGQMRLGGWTGLLIGAGTPYRLESVEGLGGHDVRSSDTDFPRGDGAQRGVDLQTARQVLLRLNFHDLDPDLHEQLLVDLYAALTPQRDTDLPLMFRNPGRPLQQVMYRPGQLTREQSPLDMLLHTQAVLLRCADPRIYSATERVVVVPVTPAGSAVPLAVLAKNAGNARAYPLIRVANRDLVDVTSVELVNATVDRAFKVDAITPPGAELVGDMPARVTGANRSVVTVGGTSVYGAWAPPRSNFFIGAPPEAPVDGNALYLRTVPAGAAVTCTVTYGDTSSS